MKYLVLLFFCFSVIAQPLSTFNDISAYKNDSGSGGQMFIQFLTNVSSTASGPTFTTPAFTPTSNALLYASVYVGNPGAITGLSNTGSTNLTWWRAVFQDVAGVGDEGIWVTQLPAGTSPFSMTVTVTCTPAAIDGAEVHIYECIGASTTQLWGSNAVVQVATLANGSSGPRAFTFLAATTTGNSVALSVNCHGTSSTPTMESGWVQGAFTGHASPNHTMATYFKTNAASFTTTYITNGALANHAVGIEFRP